MFQEEHHIQTALVHWLRCQHPEVLFTIAPSGMKLPIGVARKLKAMGYNKGTPDILIFEVKNNYPGLFIELKTEKGRLTIEQNAWLKCLDDRGYATSVCRSAAEAINVIEKYLR